MRTTLSIDDDVLVLERVRAVAAKLRTPFKAVVNSETFAKRPLSPDFGVRLNF